MRRLWRRRMESRSNERPSESMQLRDFPLSKPRFEEYRFFHILQVPSPKIEWGRCLWRKIHDKQKRMSLKYPHKNNFPKSLNKSASSKALETKCRFLIRSCPFSFPFRSVSVLIFSDKFCFFLYFNVVLDSRNSENLIQPFLGSTSDRAWRRMVDRLVWNKSIQRHVQIL